MSSHSERIPSIIRTTTIPATTASSTTTTTSSSKKSPLPRPPDQFRLALDERVELVGSLEQIIRAGRRVRTTNRRFSSYYDDGSSQRATKRRKKNVAMLDDDNDNDADETDDGVDNDEKSKTDDDDEHVSIDNYYLGDDASSRLMPHVNRSGHWPVASPSTSSSPSAPTGDDDDDVSRPTFHRPELNAGTTWERVYRGDNIISPPRHPPPLRHLVYDDVRDRWSSVTDRDATANDARRTKLPPEGRTVVDGLLMTCWERAVNAAGSSLMVDHSPSTASVGDGVDDDNEDGDVNERTAERASETLDDDGVTNKDEDEDGNVDERTTKRTSQKPNDDEDAVDNDDTDDDRGRQTRDAMEDFLSWEVHATLDDILHSLLSAARGARRIWDWRDVVRLFDEIVAAKEETDGEDKDEEMERESNDGSIDESDRGSCGGMNGLSSINAALNERSVRRMKMRLLEHYVRVRKDDGDDDDDNQLRHIITNTMGDWLR